AARCRPSAGVDRALARLARGRGSRARPRKRALRREAARQPPDLLAPLGIFHEPALALPARPQLEKGRLLLLGLLPAIGTARMEAAPARPVERRRNHAWNDGEPLLVSAQSRNRSQQPLGIWVLRIPEDVV